LGIVTDIDPCVEDEHETVAFFAISRPILSFSFAFADGFLRNTFRGFCTFPCIGVELLDGDWRLPWLASGTSGCVCPGEKGEAETSSSIGCDPDLRNTACREGDEASEAGGECCDKCVGNGSAGLLKRDLMALITWESWFSVEAAGL